MSIHDTMNDPKHAVWVSLLVMVFWGIFVIIPRNLVDILFEVTEFDYLTELIISFVVQFLSAGFAFLILVPLLLGVPTKISPFRSYLKSIHLIEFQNLKKLIFIGLTITIYIIFFALFLPSTTGDLLLYPEKVFGHPVRNTEVPAESTMGWFAFIYMLIPGIWEEVLARGIILAILLKKYPEEKGQHHKAILLGGFIFGLTHLLDIPELITSPTFVLGQLVWAAVIGIAWGYVRVGTNSLLPGIISHWLVDSFSAYLGFSGDMMVFLVLFMLSLVISSVFTILLVYQTTDLGSRNQGIESTNVDSSP
jgi:membrane protease YdiL (CAAX protease family)